MGREHDGHEQTPPTKRPFCLRCSKPARVCLCSRLKNPAVENSVGITILQHSREKRHPLNSARVAVLGLANLAVVPVTDIATRARFVVRPLGFRGGIRVSGRDDDTLSADGERCDLENVRTCVVSQISDRLEVSGSNDVVVVDEKCDFENVRASIVSQNSDPPEISGSNGAVVDEKCDFGDVRTCVVSQISDHLEVSDYNGVAVDEKCDIENVRTCIVSQNSDPLEPSGFNGVSVDGKCDFGNVGKGLGEDGEDEKSQSAVRTCIVSQNPDPLEASGFNGVLVDEKCDFGKGLGEDGEDEKSQSAVRTCIVSQSYDHLLISVDKAAKIVLDGALTSPIGKAASANGFVVKKFQRKQISSESKLAKEFEVVIPPGTALLFPGKRSICLDEVDFRVKHLIVLDGTWAKARRMYYENPWLQLLPHLKLDTEEASLYSEVRHQPKAGCLSTIESIVCALKGLGDDSEGLNDLLDVFQSMVWDQRRCKDEKFGRITSPKRVN